MKSLILLFILVPALWSRPVQLSFQDVLTYYGGDQHQLGDFYNGGPGGDYGIHSLGGLRDAFVATGNLHFPQHGPGMLRVESGFHNYLTIQYSGVLPYPALPVTLWHQGKFVQEIDLPKTPPLAFLSTTVQVQGVADEIWFGVAADGSQLGNAGDLVYKFMEVDLIDPPPPPQQQVKAVRAAAVTTEESKPSPVVAQVKAAPVAKAAKPVPTTCPAITPVR